MCKKLHTNFYYTLIYAVINSKGGSNCDHQRGLTVFVLYFIMHSLLFIQLKFRGIESCLMGTGSVWDDENISGMDSGDGCTTL